MCDTIKLLCNSTDNVLVDSFFFHFQFTGDILDCCMHLLENSRLTDKACGDPVLVARNISALVSRSAQFR